MRYFELRNALENSDEARSVRRQMYWKRAVTEFVRRLCNPLRDYGYTTSELELTMLPDRAEIGFKGQPPFGVLRKDEVEGRS